MLTRSQVEIELEGGITQTIIKRVGAGEAGVDGGRVNNVEATEDIDDILMNARSSFPCAKVGHRWDLPSQR